MKTTARSSFFIFTRRMQIILLHAQTYLLTQCFVHYSHSRTTVRASQVESKPRPRSFTCNQLMSRNLLLDKQVKQLTMTHVKFSTSTRTQQTPCVSYAVFRPIGRSLITNVAYSRSLRYANPSPWLTQLLQYDTVDVALYLSADPDFRLADECRYTALSFFQVRLQLSTLLLSHQYRQSGLISSLLYELWRVSQQRMSTVADLDCLVTSARVCTCLTPSSPRLHRPIRAYPYMACLFDPTLFSDLVFTVNTSDCRPYMVLSSFVVISA